MQPLDLAQYQSWRANAEILEKDRYGEKVLRLADGTFLKLFRRKSWLSKTAFYPPAKRFADNAAELERLNIPCPCVLQLYKLENPYRSVVHYDPLPGLTLRQLLNLAPDRDQVELFGRLAEFITLLHDLGIYFRSLHMGNIVLTPEGRFGLIDISDMRCLGRPLSQQMRARNYRHLMRYEEDWSLVSSATKALFAAEKK
ncbi:toluene tolerance protein [Pseudomonas sp. gcc21]|uniref:toluene tolerance protein n=1 Tax=Pseudomonas sp. gcc21 TaxID=2726989 RepID=UPI0014528C1B|nr:toluene tolerance protein [Pseudomonas sp. gcc21]QJD59012.1 toluene tolerance protein [Pseudomonas sp. gcc21]